MANKKKSKLAESLTETNEVPENQEAAPETPQAEAAEKQIEEDLGNVVEYDENGVVSDLQKQLDEAHDKYIALNAENEILKGTVDDLKAKLEEEKKKSNDLQELINNFNTDKPAEVHANEDVSEYLNRIEDLKNKLRENEQEGMNNSFLVVKLQAENEKLQKMLMEQSKRIARKPTPNMRIIGGNSDSWN
jgi:chromosome segregation ATPase